MIGQDPAQHETAVRRVLIGETSAWSRRGFGVRAIMSHAARLKPRVSQTNRGPRVERHPDSDRLLSAVFPFAQQMLAKRGTFLPFGATVLADGNVALAAGMADALQGVHSKSSTSCWPGLRNRRPRARFEPQSFVMTGGLLARRRARSRTRSAPRSGIPQKDVRASFCRTESAGSAR